MTGHQVQRMARIPIWTRRRTAILYGVDARADDVHRRYRSQGVIRGRCRCRDGKALARRIRFLIAQHTVTQRAERAKPRRIKEWALRCILRSRTEVQNVVLVVLRSMFHAPVRRRRPALKAQPHLIPDDHQSDVHVAALTVQFVVYGGRLCDAIHRCNSSRIERPNGLRRRRGCENCCG